MGAHVLPPGSCVPCSRVEAPQGKGSFSDRVSLESSLLWGSHPCSSSCCLGAFCNLAVPWGARASGTQTSGVAVRTRQANAETCPAGFLVYSRGSRDGVTLSH